MVKNPVVLSIVFFVIVVYYILFASLGSSSSNADYSSEKGGSLYVFEILLWAIFILLILLNGMYYFFNINVIASIRNLFGDIPEVKVLVDTGDLKVHKNAPIKDINKEQVFHIPNNEFTYDDSKAICKALNARLANYNEMEDSYNNGADWCSYGWSEGQMAYFPTQKTKWDNLQKVKGHENDCGRPGINGGYISNPKVKFGVNCFGYKPKLNQISYTEMMETPMYPKTQEEIEFDKQVVHWKTKIPDLLIAPFNQNKWSVI
jgi:heme/copper-type cytochrome/quinol oxidase subunit 2